MSRLLSTGGRACCHASGGSNFLFRLFDLFGNHLLVTVLCGCLGPDKVSTDAPTKDMIEGGGRERLATVDLAVYQQILIKLVSDLLRVCPAVRASVQEEHARPSNMAQGSAEDVHVGTPCSEGFPCAQLAQRLDKVGHGLEEADGADDHCHSPTGIPCFFEGRVILVDRHPGTGARANLPQGVKVVDYLDPEWHYHGVVLVFEDGHERCEIPHGFQEEGEADVWM